MSDNTPRIIKQIKTEGDITFEIYFDKLINHVISKTGYKYILNPKKLDEVFGI